MTLLPWSKKRALEELKPQVLSIPDMLEEMAQHGFPHLWKADLLDGKWYCKLEMYFRGARIEVGGEWTPVLYDAVSSCYRKMRGLKI